MTIKKKIIYLLLSSVLWSSCNDYLEVTPDNRQELRTLNDLKEMLVFAYSEGSYTFIEWRTDNALAIADNQQQDWLHENFRFQPVVSYEGQDTPSYLWDKNYYAIAHANQVLLSLDEVENTDQALFNAIKGEALVCRAYNHFILATIFCQHYDAATASSEMGVPYVDKAETELIVQYERGTLEETFRAIEKDLLEGIPLLNDSYLKGSGKYHFNTKAAHAFASRFYLYKKEWDKCIEYSNKVLGAQGVDAGLCRNAEGVFKGNSSKEIAAQFADVRDRANLLAVRKETLVVTRAYKGYRARSEHIRSIFNKSVTGSSDYRAMVYSYSSQAAFIPKFGEYFRYTTATSGYPYYIHIELRAEESLLNRMEAYLAKGDTDKFLEDYNYFASTRYRNVGQLSLEDVKAYYKKDTEEALFQLLIDERRKEFFEEGLRWWDVKRFNIPIEHIDVEGNVFVLESVDLKKVLQIPQSAISKGLSPNPR